MQRNKISFKGQKIFLGIDVHAKTWEVAVLTESGYKERHPQEASSKSLFDFLRKHFGAPDISCGLGGPYPSTVNTLNMKKETSLTPLKSALKIFIFEFKDSAEALVSLSMK